MDGFPPIAGRSNERSVRLVSGEMEVGVARCEVGQSLQVTIGVEGSDRAQAGWFVSGESDRMFGAWFWKVGSQDIGQGPEGVQFLGRHGPVRPEIMEARVVARMGQA